jgi:hypothetical protein
MFEAGQWLRKLHEQSSHGNHTIDLSRTLEKLHERIELEEQISSRHAKSALKVLEDAFRRAGRNELTVPVVLSHGDFMLANLRWSKADRRLFVVDFEHFAAGSTWQDMLSLVFDLRSQLLNPLIPKRMILSLEKSFWAGYGPIAKEIVEFVNGVASARVFYYHLPQALKKRTQKGGVARATASVYRTFLEPSMLARCLEGM